MWDGPRAGEAGPVNRGLYALKPWYSTVLAGVLDRLARRGVSPNAVTVAGVCCGAAAGLVLAVVPSPPLAALLVALLLAARLAAANLDGALARRTGRSTRWGAVCNELGDRGAELAVLAGCFALAPAGLVLVTMLAASAPSWVSLAGAAARASRINGGPVGKTERCLLVTVLAAVPAHAGVVLGVLAAGSVVTAALRLRVLHGQFRRSPKSIWVVPPRAADVADGRLVTWTR
jgi:CDP-diacylglycerol--glycerol-3-phosphate 3-phosphatidyltransferase